MAIILNQFTFIKLLRKYRHQILSIYFLVVEANRSDIAPKGAMKHQLLIFLLIGFAQCLSSTINDDAIEIALSDSHQELQEQLRAHNENGRKSLAIPGHQRFIRNIEGSQKMEKRNALMRLARSKLVNESGLTEAEVANKLREFELKLTEHKTLPTDVCNTTVIPCSKEEIRSKFAPIGGRCNNIKNPSLGNAKVPFRRILKPCFRDAVNTRTKLLPSPVLDSKSFEWDKRENSTTCPLAVEPIFEEAELKNKGNCKVKTQLPNVRLVSTTFHIEGDNPNPKLTHLFPMFGQFVGHDTSFTTLQLTVEDCCTKSALNDSHHCWPIFVPAGDKFFPEGTCLHYPRTVTFCEHPGCQRDQLNSLTSYLDAGNVYGENEGASLRLRTQSGGLMLTSEGSLLPYFGVNVTAGERRAIENPALTSMHTIFMREHNRLADIISKNNPKLNDEQIYKHAKRIMTAEYQSIVAGEFLPLLLASDTIFEPRKVQTKYDPEVDPSVINEFTTAADRFGHSMVNGFFKKVGPTSSSEKEGYLLRHSFENVSIYGNNPDVEMTKIVKGLTVQASQMVDECVTEELSNFLYATNVNNFASGQDLTAKNLQRGRDHGLRGWADYRKLCTGSVPEKWNSELPKDISPKKWSILSQLYEDVRDIDLFTGGLLEEPIPNGVMGITFTCISKMQFKKFISGDRYFFSHSGNVGSKFSEKQVEAIRNVKIRDIICLNTNISMIQSKAFEIVSSENPLQPCTTFKGLDFSLFKKL